MATKAHAFFCFEVLSARFDGTPHPDLRTIVEMYDAPEDVTKDRNVSNSDGQEADDKADGARHEKLSDRLQLPSITRLQASTPSTGSQSSSPASLSVNSSTSQLASPTDSSISSPPSYASRLSLTESYPLFVTWNTLSSSGHRSLRGCIGTFSPMPLEDGLEQYALTSAFDDTRFAPIPASQLPSLSCSLTLLADFEQCAGAMDWNLGEHGIRISFTYRSQKCGATYLPDVAVEQGWTKEETLDSLMRKAGWSSGRRTSKSGTQPWNEFNDFKVVRYTGLKASASYKEWQEWRASTKLSQ